MAVAFTYDVTTDRGKVRLKISDTISTAYWFEDDEIDEFISEGGDNIAAAILAIRALMMSKALRAKKFILDDLEYDDRGQVSALKSVLDGLLAASGGDMPSIVITEPAPMPMDDGYDPDSP